MLGIAGTIRDHPSVYREHRLWVVEDGVQVAAAALQTPPYNLVVAQPVSTGALVALAAAIEAEAELPGVTGAIPEVEIFATAWKSRTGAAIQRRMAQRIYKLTELRPPVGVPGGSREATESDRELLVSWVRAFAEEANPAGVPAHVNLQQTVDARLRHGTGAFVLWEYDEQAVSLAGWGGQTPTGVRVGPVYTPPQHRRQGYASAITAAVSAERLAAGRQFCFLYTDLANPTSNRIYTAIGYESVCDSLDYAFDPD
ncbi:MAG: GNAT family N-acetyltransferase [Actinobacteria bacterium]|nr:GNAT family N-acetyltransferase [Actinomycetota bacterium]